MLIIAVLILLSQMEPSLERRNLYVIQSKILMSTPARFYLVAYFGPFARRSTVVLQPH
jgi:hypothetical protein